jgi:CheY-like chemotaxis protein
LNGTASPWGIPKKFPISTGLFRNLAQIPFFKNLFHRPLFIYSLTSFFLSDIIFLPWEVGMAQKETILIVEDEAGPRESLRMILKPFYDLYTASNGQDAIHLVQNQNISLVTLDLNMPGLSGIDVLKEIKKMKPDIEVIIITALTTLPNAQKGMRFGASDFISKPFHVSEVLTVVQKSLERRNNNLENKIMDTADQSPQC